ncbi:MAG: uridine kinase [Thermonemataceae bacterium]|nr:uridine kinase [Thermonemataceae bacterium]
MNKQPFIIGITGGSASGKTSFLKNLIDTFSEDELCLISQDNYYRPKEEQPVDENGIHNFDLPESINAQEYARDIQKLRNGETVYRLEYTFNNPDVVPKTLIFKPAPIIIVEGIFVFYYTEIANLMDLKIFIDAKEHIKLRRRIYRDQLERGYSLEDVLYRYEKHVSPTYERYIEPFKNEADIIVPNNLHYQKPLEMVVAYLESKVLKKN